jgi:hypothetical protein
MADLTPYDIRVRRELHLSVGWAKYLVPRDLDDLEAAGIVVAEQTVWVTAAYAAEEEGSHPGESVPALYAEVFAWGGEAVTRWSSSELTFADKRGNLAMRQVLARAQRVADLANDLATGTPIPMDGPTDRVVDEVAADMQRSWGLAYCTDVNAPVLEDRIARQMTFHAMARLCLIRDRDGCDPLP